MSFTYYTNGGRHEIELSGRLSSSSEILAAIECCARHAYENDYVSDWPCEIALCVGDREIGRESVGIELEPSFHVV